MLATQWHIGKNCTEFTQWVRKRKRLEIAECPKDMSKWKTSRGFANFPAWPMVREARSLQAKCSLYRCGLFRCKIQKYWSTKNNWPNHEINGSSGSPKLLIQANDRLKSKLVYWIRSIRRCSSKNGHRIRSIRRCSAQRKVDENDMWQCLYLQESLST